MDCVGLSSPGLRIPDASLLLDVQTTVGAAWKTTGEGTLTRNVVEGLVGLLLTLVGDAVRDTRRLGDLRPLGLAGLAWRLPDAAAALAYMREISKAGGCPRASRICCIAGDGPQLQTP